MGKYFRKVIIFREKRKIQNSEKPHVNHWLHDNVALMDKDFSIPNYSQINLNKETVVAIASKKIMNVQRLYEQNPPSPSSE